MLFSLECGNEAAALFVWSAATPQSHSIPALKRRATTPKALHDKAQGWRRILPHTLGMEWVNNQP
jgi:hypothetical protein